NALGTFDPTGLPNGAYEIKLNVVDWVDGTSVETSPIILQLGDAMKVGQFTLAFTDLQIPVSGLPITLTRTYDSRETSVGDFGAAWKLDVTSITLQKSGSLGQDWATQTSGGGLNYCINETLPHLITITFPGGKIQQFRPQITVNSVTNSACGIVAGINAADFK